METTPEFKKYKRKGLIELREYIYGEDLSYISVSQEDDPPNDMGMIARNPQNHCDQWYVAREYFNDNYEIDMTRKTAIRYARAIWGRIAETGKEKRDVIADLINEKILPKGASEWHDLCPFCEEYESEKCFECPWPGKGFRRCADPDSPFEKWVYSWGITNDMNAARAVYDLICGMS